MGDGATLRILKCYVGTNVLNFVELCRKADYPTDLGGYYIRRLVNAGCLTKIERGQYKITPHGKQSLLRLESQQGRSISARSRLCSLAVVKQGEKLVVTRRKRQPFIGFVEWPSIMLLPGEHVTEGILRQLHSCLSVTAEVRLLGFFRRIDLYEGIVFDDKLFAVHSCRLNEQSGVAERSIFGDNLVLSPKELRTVDQPSRALHDIFSFSQAPSAYQERCYALSLRDIIPE